MKKKNQCIKYKSRVTKFHTKKITNCWCVKLGMVNNKIISMLDADEVDLDKN